MSAITLFVLLTGIAAGVVWWLGFRMARRGYAILDTRTERKHRKAA